MGGESRSGFEEMNLWKWRKEHGELRDWWDKTKSALRSKTDNAQAIFEWPWWHKFSAQPNERGFARKRAFSPFKPIRFSRATYILCKPYTKQAYTLIISNVKCVGFGLKILHKTLHCVGLRGTVCRVGMIEKRTCRVGRKKQKTPFSSHFLPFRAGKCKNRRFHRTFCFKKGALLAKLGALLVLTGCAPSFNRVRS